MTVRYTARARNDLRSILTYVETRSPQGARNIARAMRKTIALIEQFPESGRLAGEQGTRVLSAGHYPYLVYWSVENHRAVDCSHSAHRAAALESGSGCLVATAAPRPAPPVTRP